MVASGRKPSSSMAPPERFSQQVQKPKDLAPAASQALDETKPMESRSRPNEFTASWYTFGLGFYTPVSSTLMTWLKV